MILLTLIGGCRTPLATLEGNRSLAGEPEINHPPLEDHLPQIPGLGYPARIEAGAGAGIGEPGVSEEQVELLLNRLSLEQRIGQRFIGRFPGVELSRRGTRMIREGYLGGVVLTNHNIRSREQIKALTRALQRTAAQANTGIGLLIGIDQEGGRVNRLETSRISRFPAPFYWGEYGDLLFIQAIAYITGREVRQLGFNLNFAPVLDLYGRPDASIIGDRSMGSDPRRVGLQGLYYLKGAKLAGIAAVIKHFPGHGRTTVDSHVTLPVVDVDEKTLRERDLLPFAMAIENGAEAVMTAHILYPQLDPRYPVTLSQRILKGILRNELGFEGVIISDDITMRALTEHFSLREILKYSLKAGVDLILDLGTQDTRELQQTVLSLYQAGELTQADIDQGVRRVLRLKIKCGILPG